MCFLAGGKKINRSFRLKEGPEPKHQNITKRGVQRACHDLPTNHKEPLSNQLAPRPWRPPSPSLGKRRILTLNLATTKHQDNHLLKFNKRLAHGWISTVYSTVYYLLHFFQSTSLNNSTILHQGSLILH